MKIPFWKMNGAGNDFVMIDRRSGGLTLSDKQIERICHRNFGIGADGLLAVENSQNADFRMRYYNADGGEADMCGNGARCFARFAMQVSGKTGNSLSFETQAGIIQAELDGERVAIRLTPPKEIRLDHRLAWDDAAGNINEMLAHDCNTGVPHAVLFVDDVEKVPVNEWGRAIRFHDEYKPKGTNVNFAMKTGLQSLRVRTYERGVEGETLACGTGVTASALLAAITQKMESPILVSVKGGDTLEVNFTAENGMFDAVTLKGPAEFVFSGEIEV